MTGAGWTGCSKGLVELSHDWEGDEPPPLRLLSEQSTPSPPGPLALGRLPARAWARSSGYCAENGRWLFLFAPESFPDVEPSGNAPSRILVAGTFNDWSPGPEWEMRREDNPDGPPTWTLSVQCAEGASRCPGAASAPAQPCIAGDGGADFKFVTSDGVWLEIPEFAPNRVRDMAGNHNFRLDPRRTGRHVFQFSVPHDTRAVRHARIAFATDGENVLGDGTSDAGVRVADAPYLFSRDSKLEMGVMPRKDGAPGMVFRIFAPRATAVTLEIWAPGAPAPHEHVPLVPLPDGAWEATHGHAAPGWRYQYHVEGENRDTTTAFDAGTPVLDPCARACEGPAGPGIITVPAATRRPPHTPPAPTDAVFVEAHLRDLLGGAPGGFRELAAWIRSPGCHLRRLGANVLELLPVTEYERGAPDEYHWGYMPVNWFSPASAYASAPGSASQAGDFRELVDACHDAGISLVLDVVYNHLGAPNALAGADSGYYFAADRLGVPTNWSGCGNDLRPDAPLARRLVVDSLRHFVTEFDVDGFRFDLAELLGLPLLRQIEREIRPLKPGLLLVAEPWSFRGHIGRALATTGYSSWNDAFREFLPAYVHNAAGAAALRHHLAGSPCAAASHPFHSLNYAQSHDDLCWLDRITGNPANNGASPTEADARRTRLMHAILLAALGVPMLAAGQDFLHSKHGISNTYQRGDLNALDYSWDRAAGEIAGRRRQTHEHARAWIAFRLGPRGAALRVGTRPGEGFLRFHAEESAGGNALATLYNADGRLGVPRLLFAVNPAPREARIPLSDTGTARFLQLADADVLLESGIPASRAYPIVDGCLRLPPLASGLWVET